MRSNLVLLRAALAAGLMGGLSISASGADIASGNASMNILESMQAGTFSPFAAPGGDGALRLDGPGSTDVLYKYCWYYRTSVSTRPRLFAELLAPTKAISDNTATFTWTSNGDGVATGPGRFDATLRLTLTDGPVAGAGRVVSSMRIRNAGTGPTTIRIYELVDLDLPGGTPNPAPDDTLALLSSAPLEARYTESSTTNYALVDAPGANHHRIDSGLALRNMLLATSTTDLAAEVAPYSGDGAIAYQWTLALAAGEERTLESTFTVNMPTNEPACRADFNSSGDLGVQDIFDFLIAYFAGSAAADINGASGVTVQDIFDYLILYFNGC